MTIKEIVFIKHEECRLVSGYSRGILYDLNRSNFKLIPLEFVSFVNEINKKTYSEIQSYIKENKIFLDYYDFIIDNEIGFFCDSDEVNFFPSLNLDWREPSYINNCVIDFNFFKFIFNSSIDRVTLFKKLDELLVRFLVLRIDDFHCDDLIEIQNVLFCSKNLGIRGIHIILTTNECINLEFHSFLVSFLNLNKEVVKIIVNCKKEIFVESSDIIVYNDFFGFQINYISNVGLNLFLESQDYHPFFNRKLYINSIGDIMNSRECENSFGNIKDGFSLNNLKSIISSLQFKKYWRIRKDSLDICKDCEFRFMCVDNRLPYKRKENEWFHKIECNYNPYIAKWEGEEGYRTLVECGVVSNENEFSIDHEKIAAINQELWGEDE